MHVTGKISTAEKGSSSSSYETGRARMEAPLDLGAVFKPSSVAIVGASGTMGKWSHRILTNILAGGYKGAVYPVNPNEKQVCGMPCYPSLREIHGPVDLVIVATPAALVPSILRDCTAKGVGGVVLISSGFGETGEAGRRLEEEIVSYCTRHRVPLIGPNTMGIVSTHAGLYATGSHARPQPGSIAFVSQSGNLGLQLIHWAGRQGIGISLFVGSGNEGMLSSVDYLEYLETDSTTRTIILYLEGVDQGRRFFEAARRTARHKPIIILKGGRTDSGRRAAASHTGSMGGSREVFSAAVRQSGIVEAWTPTELLELSAGFSSLPLIRGNRVGIVSLGGGWAVVTSDACREAGLEVPPLPDHIIRAIDPLLPPFWSRSNPIDLVGTQNPQASLVALEELTKWDGVDGVICLGITGQPELIQLTVASVKRVDPDASHSALDEYLTEARDFETSFKHFVLGLMEQYGKPIVGVSLAPSHAGTVLHRKGSPYAGVFFQSPESAVQVLTKMAEYRRFLEDFASRS